MLKREAAQEVAEVPLALERQCKKETFQFFLQWCSRHFWHRVSIGSGCSDKQAGERPWIGSAEEDFFQVGQNKGPSHHKKAFLVLISIE